MATDEEGMPTDMGREKRWDILPLHLWERILSYLPVSALVRAACVCRTFLSLLRSPPFRALHRSLPPDPRQDILLLLFSSPFLPPRAATYHPFLDRWFMIPLPSLVIASAGPHVLLGHPLRLASFPFRHPPSLLPPLPTPFYTLSLLPHRSSFSLLAVSTSDRIRSLLYHSRSARWSPAGDLPLRVSLLAGAAEVAGALYCLARVPDMLLRFDPAAGEWTEPHVPVPPLACTHLAGWGGRLWLLGGLAEEGGGMAGVAVWEMEWTNMGQCSAWREVGLMPPGLFGRLGGSDMGGFEVVDRRGVVCFCNTESGALVLCDLRVMRWWTPAPCPFSIVAGKDGWLGHAIEPWLELLLPQCIDMVSVTGSRTGQSL